MKKYYTLIGLLLLISNYGRAQQKIIDSLEQQLTNPTNGNTRLRTLIDLGYYYQNVNPEKGLLRMEEATDIALKNKDSFKLAIVNAHKGGNNFKLGKDSLGFVYLNKAGDIFKAIDSTKSSAIHSYNIAIQYIQRSNYKNAISNLKETLDYFRIKNDTLTIANTMSLLGYCYINDGDYTNSMKIFLKGKSLLENSKKEELIEYGNLIGNMGILYQRLKKYDIALELHKKALEIFKNKDNQNQMASQYTNIGTIYGKKADSENELIYHQQAYNVYKKSKDIRSQSSALMNISVSYSNQKKYSKAISFIDSAIVINKKLKDYSLLATNYNNKADAYRNKNDFPRAKKNYDLALLYVDKLEDERIISEIRLGASKVAFKTGNYKSAYINLEEARVLKDSLLNDEKKRRTCCTKSTI